MIDGESEGVNCDKDTVMRTGEVNQEDSEQNEVDEGMCSRTPWPRPRPDHFGSRPRTPMKSYIIM